MGSQTKKIVIVLSAALLLWGGLFVNAFLSAYHVNTLSYDASGDIVNNKMCFVKASNLKGDFIQGLGETSLCKSLEKGDTVIQDEFSNEIKRAG